MGFFRATRFQTHVLEGDETKMFLFSNFIFGGIQGQDSPQSTRGNRSAFRKRLPGHDGRLAAGNRLRHCAYRVVEAPGVPVKNQNQADHRLYHTN